jgi:glyoxylase I family protein
MFTGLEHIAIASPNPLHLAEWYVQHLGFRINYEYAGNYFVKAPDGSMVSEGERAQIGMKDPGLRHLAIKVDDFDASHRQLQSQGVHFVTEPYINQGNRLVFFTDADGNLLHLIERERPLP